MPRRHAVFSRDGEHIYSVASTGNKAALRVVTLGDNTESIVQVRDVDEPALDITSSDDDQVYCVSAKALWLVNPTSGVSRKIIHAPEKAHFRRAAYNPKLRAVFVTSDEDPLIMVKDEGKDVTPVFVRRHPGIGCPVFSSDGELFYSNNGDLWRGTIETDEERVKGSCERYWR